MDAPPRRRRRLSSRKWAAVLRALGRGPLLRLIASVTLAALAAASEAPAADLTGFYRGTLGRDLAVGVSLRANAGAVEGFYYYARIGVDIPVKGTLSPAGELTLEESGRPDTVTGRWVGRFEAGAGHAPDRVAGTWRDPQHPKKEIAFELARVTPLAAEAEAAHPSSPGDAEHAEISAEDLAYRLTALGTTGIQLPRLTRFHDAAVMKAVNEQIDQMGRDLPCDDAPTPSKARTLEAAVTYAAHDILSLAARLSYYCGGPYPTDDLNVSRTFDLKTGKEVRFPALFRAEAPRDALLRALFGEALRRAAQPPAEAAEDGGCGEVFTLEQLRASSFAFSLTPAGLIVQPAEWPHVIAACAERVSVPYERVQRFADPGGVLVRIPSPAR
jgi:hypothetical protein